MRTLKRQILIFTVNVDNFGLSFTLNESEDSAVFCVIKAHTRVKWVGLFNPTMIPESGLPELYYTKPRVLAKTPDHVNLLPPTHRARHTMKERGVGWGWLTQSP